VCWYMTVYICHCHLYIHQYLIKKIIVIFIIDFTEFFSIKTVAQNNDIKMGRLPGIPIALLRFLLWQCSTHNEECVCFRCVCHCLVFHGTILYDFFHSLECRDKIANVCVLSEKLWTSFSLYTISEMHNNIPQL
jgi:hypothetical protein